MTIKPAFGTKPEPAVGSVKASAGPKVNEKTNPNPPLPNLPSSNPNDIGPNASAQGNNAPPTAPPPDVDWASLFWGSLGLPPDVANQINDIFKKYPDASMAQTIATNYLQQTQWFQDTFPGYALGEQNGLYTDVNGYRSYVGDLNRLSMQYDNTPITTGAVLSSLQGGVNPAMFENQLQGKAYLKANQADIQYTEGAFGVGEGAGPNGQFSQQQLQAFSNQQVGLNSTLGFQLDTAFKKAQQRMQKIFQGTLARPAGMTIGQQGLNAPGLLGSKQPSSISGNADIPA